jgi:hypothetical protein
MQPGEAALGRHDEEEHEFRPNRQDGPPVVELRTDLWRVLGRFVDLQADDCGAVASLEDDDAVRPSRQETCVTGRRLREPELDRGRHLLCSSCADKSADAFDAVESMTNVGKAADPLVVVAEPAHSLTGQPIRDWYSATP